MKRNYFYSVGLCFIAVLMAGCACKHWDWVCTSCKPKTMPADAVSVAESKTALVQDVASAVDSVVAEPVVVVPAVPAVVSYHFGDHKSSTLTTKAWQALAQQDYEAVFAYTNKCIDMYSAEAAKMQSGLKDYPSGEAQQVFSFWALNDVATCLYIQGEAYRKMQQMDRAKAAYQRVMGEFSYGQAYDPGSKTFWKPAEAATDGMYMIEKKLDLNFGDMTSQFIVRKMWESLAKQNLDEVVGYGMKLERLYSQTAKEMMTTLKEYPQLPAEKIHLYWALNDVGTGVFILGEAYNIAGMKDEAVKAYDRVSKEYFYAQCWDPQGWFWKPAEAAQQKILEIESQKKE